MIKTNIATQYSHHLINYQLSKDSIFIADYTEQTKTLAVKRGVEIFVSTPPTDIDFFSVINKAPIEIGSIIFDHTSFVYPDGNTRSQCECFIFPEASGVDSWILFAELKYSNKPLRNTSNLSKAIKQLFKTRRYYYMNGVISKSNTCYLIASLPMQAEPFANFSITPTLMQNLKIKLNVILRLKNSVEIVDDKTIDV